MSDILIIDALTGETIQRPFTDAEANQRALDEKNAKTEAAEQKAHQAKMENVRKAAMSHAKSLGFTDEMISVMYPTLVEE